MFTVVFLMVFYSPTNLPPTYVCHLLPFSFRRGLESSPGLAVPISLGNHGTPSEG